MQLIRVLTGLGCLCFLLSDAFTDSQDESPEIIGPSHIQLKACPGKQLVLHCKAYHKCEDDLTLIYWLVNGSFPESASTNGRVVESEESMSQDGKILQRSLVLKNVTPEDYRSTFVCVVASPAGMAQKHVTLNADPLGKQRCTRVCRLMRKKSTSAPY